MPRPPLLAFPRTPELRAAARRGLSSPSPPDVRTRAAAPLEPSLRPHQPWCQGLSLSAQTTVLLCRGGGQGLQIQRRMPDNVQLQTHFEKCLSTSQVPQEINSH